MNIKQLKQHLTQRGLPTDGLKPVLVERLTQAMQQTKGEEEHHDVERGFLHAHCSCRQ